MNGGGMDEYLGVLVREKIASPPTLPNKIFPFMTAGFGTPDSCFMIREIMIREIMIPFMF